MSSTSGDDQATRHGLPRSSLACLRCRAAKSKCDGLIPSAIANANPNQALSKAAIDEEIQAEVSCSRCARLNLECRWRPCHRSGRPSTKRQRTSSSGQEDHADGRTTRPEPSKDALPVDANLFPPLEETMQFSQDLMTDFSQLFDESIFPEAGTVPPPQGFSDVLSSSPVESAHARSHSPAQSTSSQITEMSKRIRDSKVYPPIGSTPQFSFCESNKSSIESGIRRYFASVGLAIPLYEGVEHLHRMASRCEAQQYVIAALGHAVYEGHDGTTSKSMRREAIASIASGTFQRRLMYSLDPIERIAHLSSLIPMAYIDYAMQDFESLDHRLEQAVQTALASDLHLLDDGSANRLTSEPDHIDAARRVWWELWILDCIVDVVTSGKVKRRLADARANVRFPAQEDPVMQQAYKIRVEAVSLLIGATTVSPSAKDKGRLRSADNVQANVIAEAQILLLSVTRARRAAQDDWSLQSKQAILFDCLMMLHAGRIHLHRLFWFADLTLDLTSCSFQRDRIKESSAQDPSSPGLHIEPDTGVTIAYSVDKIAQSSESILRLMQLDTDAFFQQSIEKIQRKSVAGLDDDPLPITSSHWPPIGCCQMVASYGLVVCIAAGIGTDVSTGPFPALTNDGDALTQNESLSEIQAQQSISSIGMAEASLGILSEVWPIAASYRKEVHLCRLAINQVLPS